MDWSGFIVGAGITENFFNVLKAYHAEGEQIDRNLVQPAFFAVIGNALNWLFFNIKRSMDNSIEINELTMAQVEINKTLKNIHYINNNFMTIMNLILPNRL